MEQAVTSFEEGERFLKRNYEAWLIKDDQFVEYLMNEVKMIAQWETERE